MKSNITQKIRIATHPIHEQLDHRIMASAPFTFRNSYIGFLSAQHQFHLTLDPLFEHEHLRTHVPDLARRRRLPQIESDLKDLGVEPHPSAVASNLSLVSPATAWGWFYVAEGSKLGAAILLKHAAKLGLSDTFGARHLAGHPDGRAKHWHAFTEAMDNLYWNQAETIALAEAAQQAFIAMLGYVEQFMPIPTMDNKHSSQTEVN